MAPHPIQQALAPAGAISEGRLQLGLASVDQVVADVVERFARAVIAPRHLNRSPRHLDLVGF